MSFSSLGLSRQGSLGYCMALHACVEAGGPDGILSFSSAAECMTGEYHCSAHGVGIRLL